MCWKVGKKTKNTGLLERSAPHFYQFARDHIACDCPKCKCPARSAWHYSFVYIDEPAKLMYFDVPKSASTTIRKAFFDDRSSASLRNPRKGVESYLKFSFVRNPWDRMVSNWKMFTTQSARIEQLRSMTLKDLSRFEDFVDFAVANANHHWQPQVMFLPETLDFIGKLECFDEDMNRLLSLLGKDPVDLKKRNSTRRDRYQEYYTPRSIEVVSDYYRKDIEMFGYRF